MPLLHTHTHPQKESPQVIFGFLHAHQEMNYVGAKWTEVCEARELLYLENLAQI